MRPAVPADGPMLEALKSVCAARAGAGRGAPGCSRGTRPCARSAAARPSPRKGAGSTRPIARGARAGFARFAGAVNGREISVEIFTRGDLIADGALAPETPLGNDWEAVETSTRADDPARGACSPACAATPELALALAAELVARLERSKQLATGLALSGVQERVVSRLVALGRQDGTAGPEGLLIRNRPTQQELANQIGACRETVSRTVSELVRQGLLTPRGRSLLVSRRLVENAA